MNRSNATIRRVSATPSGGEAVPNAQRQGVGDLVMLSRDGVFARKRGVGPTLAGASESGGARVSTLNHGIFSGRAWRAANRRARSVTGR